MNVLDEVKYKGEGHWKNNNNNNNKIKSEKFKIHEVTKKLNNKKSSRKIQKINKKIQITHLKKKKKHLGKPKKKGKITLYHPKLSPVFTFPPKL
jgi:hypothetical protein